MRPQYDPERALAPGKNAEERYKGPPISVKAQIVIFEYRDRISCDETLEPS
jgi:hypothetical protein